MKTFYSSGILDAIKEIAKKMDEEIYKSLSKKEKLATDVGNWLSQQAGLTKKGERDFFITKT